MPTASEFWNDVALDANKEDHSHTAREAGGLLHNHAGWSVPGAPPALDVFPVALELVPHWVARLSALPCVDRLDRATRYGSASWSPSPALTIAETSCTRWWP